MSVSGFGNKQITVVGGTTVTDSGVFIGDGLSIGGGGLKTNDGLTVHDDGVSVCIYEIFFSIHFQFHI